MKTLIEKYTELGLNIMANRQKFNLSKGLAFNPEWSAKQDYLYHIDRFNYIHLDSLSKGLTPIFVTLTLPSKYHQFKKKGNRHVSNPKYEGYTITQGAKKLNDIFRTLYNKHNYRENGKKINATYKYVRVIEPHKDFTPHLHAVLYVSNEERFKKHFDNTIRNNELEQVDYEVLSNEVHSLAYLLKYVSKTIEGTNMLILGWKSVHKIVQVRTSKMPFNRDEYKIFKSSVNFDPKYLNYFIQMKHQLVSYRHFAVVENCEENQFFLKQEQLHRYYDDMELEEVRYNHLSNVKYVIHTYGLKTLKYDYIPFDIEASTEKLICSEVIYDDMFNLPIYEELEGGLFVPLCDEYVAESIEDDVSNDYLLLAIKRSRKVLCVDFNSVNNFKKGE